MTTADESMVLVLRLPETEGNYQYWMAELPEQEALEWEERLAKAKPGSRCELQHTFGTPLTLNEVMQKLHTRDFRVLDYPRN